LNPHLISTDIVACLLCLLFLFVIFSHTFYNLVIRKLLKKCCFSNANSRDEANLKRFEFNEYDTRDIHGIDDIHPFFRVATSLSMLFCLIASVSSVVAVTHLLLTGYLSVHLQYIRYICFIAWLFSHYSMSSVFLGRLHISFQDSIYQYSGKVISTLSIALASFPVLLCISLLFYILHENEYSLIFFLAFMAVDLLFSIILTWLFCQKLYQLIRRRIATKTTQANTASNAPPTNGIVRTSSNASIVFEDDVQSNSLRACPAIAEVKTEEKPDITPYLGGMRPIRTELAQISVESVNLPDLCLNNARSDESAVGQDTPSNRFEVQSDAEEEDDVVTLHHNQDTMIPPQSPDSPDSPTKSNTTGNTPISQQQTPIGATMNGAADETNTEMLRMSTAETPVSTEQNTKAKPPMSLHVAMASGSEETENKESKRDSATTTVVYSDTGTNYACSGSDVPSLDAIDIAAAVTTVPLEKGNTDREMLADVVMAESKGMHPTLSRSESKLKTYMSRARSISRSISTYTVSPRQSKAFQKAKQTLDEQQLSLIHQMTQHGLLLSLTSVTSLSCVVYIMLTFEHYHSMDNTDENISARQTIAYYYLYWAMGISSFLNALSLYLSFAFAQWMYTKCCNRIHKWLEAFCVILIVKQFNSK